MSHLFCDLETFSERPLRDGTHRYAEEAEVLLWAYALDEAPVQVWDVTLGGPMPADLAAALADPSVVTVWHNGAMFDTIVLLHARGIDLPLERIHDTMVQAFMHSLPAGLGMLCEVLKVDADQSKDKEGRPLIHLFCKPRPKTSKVRRATRETHPVEWAKFVSYAGLDVVAMRACFKKMPKWNMTPREIELWHLDQRSNRRGICVDTVLAGKALAAVDRAQADLAERTSEATMGMVESATKRDQLLKYLLAAHGVELPDMQKDTLERRMNDPELPDGVRELISLRLQSSTSSTSKFKTLMRSVSSDGRLRGTKQFCGAGRTGRWAGRLFQPDNLPRPTLPQSTIEAGIEALLADCADLLFDNVMELTSNTIRSCIVAPPGKKLVVADLSNIEGRVQAWLAGETWKLDAFRAYDNGVGHDLYKMAYGGSFGVRPEDVTKDQRQIGKVQELACLAGDTVVHTSNGPKAIIDVTIDDQLWDGEAWVKHRGLVARGVRQVVRVAGISLTPDHLVLTGPTWSPAGQLATSESTLCLALATASAPSPSWASTRGLLEALLPSSLFNAIAGPSPTTSTTTTYAPGLQPRASHALEGRRDTGAKTSGLTRIWSRMTTIAAACSTAFRRASIGVTTPRIEGIQTTAAVASMSSSLGAPVGTHSSPTSSPSKGGTIQSSSWTESRLIKDTSQATFGSSPTKPTQTINGQFAVCNSESPNWKRTYDISEAGPRNRFTVLSNRGPLIVHNCGYEGGVGAFATFAGAYGLDLSVMADKAQPNIPGAIWGQANIMLEWHRSRKRDPAKDFGMSDKTWLVVESLVLGWRAAHPNIKAFWRQLRDAVIAAIECPGRTFPCGPLKIVRQGAWLRVALPSGRSLCYPSPSVPKADAPCEHCGGTGAVMADDVALDCHVCDGSGIEPGNGTGTGIRYFGVDQYTRKWKRQATYGGKLFENVCQAVARDVMAHNMPSIEARGYEIVLSVHDEVICEAPDSDEFSHTELAQLLAANPPWALDMPLAAAGFEAARYKKE